MKSVIQISIVFFQENQKLAIRTIGNHLPKKKKQTKISKKKKTPKTKNSKQPKIQ